MKSIKIVKNNYSYTYTINETQKEIDPFVAKALKIHNLSMYQELKGFTKSIKISDGLKMVDKFNDSTYIKFNFLNNDYYEAYNYAFNKAKEVFTPKKKLPMYSKYYIQHVIPTNTSAGFSFPGKKKDEVYYNIYSHFMNIQHWLKRDRKIYKLPCKLGLRGHLSKIDEKKVRGIWIYPAEITHMENVFSYNYTQWMTTCCPAVILGENSLKKISDRLNEDLTDLVELNLDWSGFDFSIQKFLIKDAFKIISDSLDYSKFYDPFLDECVTKKNWDKQYPKLFNYVKEYFINTRMMLPNGVTFEKNFGIPSGSAFTQIVGSICNYIAINTLFKLQKINIESIKVLGDDSNIRILRSDYPKLCLKTLSFDAKKYFGMELNPDKVNIILSKNDLKRKFLGYQVQGFKFIRSDFEWFKMLLYPERDINNLTVSSSRLFSFLLLGGINSRRFFDFCLAYQRFFPSTIGRRISYDLAYRRKMRYAYGIKDPTFGLSSIPKFSDLNPISVSYYLYHKDDFEINLLFKKCST